MKRWLLNLILRWLIPSEPQWRVGHETADGTGGGVETLDNRQLIERLAAGDVRYWYTIRNNDISISASPRPRSRY